MLMPYWAPLADIPRISIAPRLAEMKAMPVTQAGSERPERKKSVEVAIARRRAKPIPITNAKYGRGQRDRHRFLRRSLWVTPLEQRDPGALVQLCDLGRIILCDKAGPGVDRLIRMLTVANIECRDLYRQVALHKRLLIDREQQLTVLKGGQDGGCHVECSELHPVEGVHRVKSPAGRLEPDDARRQHAVDAWVGPECLLDGALCLV